MIIEARRERKKNQSYKDGRSSWQTDRDSVHTLAEFPSVIGPNYLELPVRVPRFLRER
jgi:hypothetical protein